MGVVVLQQVIGFSRAGLAEIELDGRVSDAEPLARPGLEITHHLLRFGQGLLLDHDVDAQRDVF